MLRYVVANCNAQVFIACTLREKLTKEVKTCCRGSSSKSGAQRWRQHSSPLSTLLPWGHGPLEFLEETGEEPVWTGLRRLTVRGLPNLVIFHYYFKYKYSYSQANYCAYKHSTTTHTHPRTTNIFFYKWHTFTMNGSSGKFICL